MGACPLGNFRKCTLRLNLVVTFMAHHLLQNYVIAIKKPTRLFTKLTRFFCRIELVFH